MSKQNCNLSYLKSEAFNMLNDFQIEVINKHSIEVIFQPGEVLIKENSPTNSVIYLKSGLVKIHQKGHNREQIIEIVKAPSYLCLHSTFADKINHFSATAIILTIVSFIEGNIFSNLIKENGKFGFEVIQNMGRSEIKSFQHLIDISQKQNIGRVAHALIYFAEEICLSNEFNLPLSRQEFADLTGITRESISRILHKFHDDNLIQIEGRKILIKNLFKLKDISLKG